MTKDSAAPRYPRATCWLIAMAAILIAGGLVALALFLPPIRLPERLLALSYSPLSRESPAAALDDRLIIALPAGAPGGDFAIKLDNRQADWLPGAMGEVPPHLRSLAAPHLLDSLGAPPASLQVALALPSAAPPQAALYGWDGAAWRFIPAQRDAGWLRGRADFLPLALGGFAQEATTPLLLISQELPESIDPAILSLADILSPAGLRPTAAGKLIGGLAAGGRLDADYLFMPVIRNFSDPSAIDSATVAALIADPALRAEHIRNLGDVAGFNGFDGLFIDYRGLPRQLRSAYADFVRDLADSLSALDLRLGLVLPAAGDEREAYDLAALGRSVDFVQLRPFRDPRAYPRIDDNLRELTEQIPRDKLLVGLSASPLLEMAGEFTPVAWHAAFAGLGDVALQADAVRRDGSLAPGEIFRAALDGYPARWGQDDASAANMLEYLDETGEVAARVWLMDAAALQHRLAQLQPQNLAGIALEGLATDAQIQRLLPLIRSYQAGQPPNAARGQFSARWTIAGQSGVVAEIQTRPDVDLVATLDAPDGLYAVNWSLVDDMGDASARSGAVLPITRATATPTPSPTPLPTSVPVVVAAPTAAAQEPAPIRALPVPVGNISVELGGQVTSVSSPRAINAMRQAGMTWLKIQVKYSRGSPPDIHSKIIEAHNHGFKILISALGYPDELGRGGPGYVSDFAHWLGRVAAWGADAIEVWNEPNLDREWPRGQISGTAYADMLRAAYQSIKRANPNVMVISAAPAPTGAAIDGRVVPDNTWLREVAAAGGADYMDCVGVHYNEGIVPPNQTSGDPRGDEYYTRYFYSGMVVGYLSIIRDKPLCFTEMGYVTSQGYGPLPSGFAWGANTTVQQQAEWLAQAAVIASNSGSVRLLIVWNIDFTRYDSDPQGGYAIIRPDGSCPACQTLAAAR